MTAFFEKMARERVGRVLSGKWRLEALLGTGGMGAVYRAKHQRNGLEVAVKLLHMSMDDDAQRRFIREGLASNLVDHPGVVSVIDDGEDAGTIYLVMELLQGRSVKTIWSEANERMAVAEVVPIIADVLDALGAAHAHGIIHRDIKPDNIFVEQDGRVRVIDFGVARLAEKPGEELTNTTHTLGTVRYMPPEQAMSRWSEVDARTDLYAVAATAFRLLTGEFVHAADDLGGAIVAAATRPARRIQSVMPELPDALAHVIDRALSFERSDRYASAAEMREAWLKASPEHEAAPKSIEAIGAVPSRRTAVALRALAKEEGPTFQQTGRIAAVGGVIATGVAIGVVAIGFSVQRYVHSRASREPVTTGPATSAQVDAADLAPASQPSAPRDPSTRRSSDTVSTELPAPSASMSPSAAVPGVVATSASIANGFNAQALPPQHDFHPDLPWSEWPPAEPCPPGQVWGATSDVNGRRHHWVCERGVTTESLRRAGDDPHRYQ